MKKKRKTASDDPEAFTDSAKNKEPYEISKKNSKNKRSSDEARLYLALGTA